MQIKFTSPPWLDTQATHWAFEVWGDEHEPGFENQYLGSGNMTFHSSHTPEDIADDTWSEAEDVRDQGIENLQLYAVVSGLITTMQESQ